MPKWTVEPVGANTTSGGNYSAHNFSMSIDKVDYYYNGVQIANHSSISVSPTFSKFILYTAPTTTVE